MMRSGIPSPSGTEIRRSVDVEHSSAHRFLALRVRSPRSSLHVHRPLPLLHRPVLHWCVPPHTPQCLLAPFLLWHPQLVHTSLAPTTALAFRTARYARKFPWRLLVLLARQAPRTPREWSVNVVRTHWMDTRTLAPTPTRR
ncbi:hypothetical protein K438DRAFT_1954223 [Mycena galopus ATCC 62051]|nr:hypothetical protein K438DRAFT_1954223 [Mycena galopus ATCC 62051]